MKPENKKLTFTIELNSEPLFCNGCPFIGTTGNYCKYYLKDIDLHRQHYQAYELTPSRLFPVRCDRCIDEHGI